MALTIAQAREKRKREETNLKQFPMAEEKAAPVRREDMVEISTFARLNTRKKEALAELSEVEVRR